MPKPPTAPVVATGLVGGFAIARYSGRRELGGLFYAACGAWCAREGARPGGAQLTLPRGLPCVAPCGAPHPLAKKTGPWPSVAAVTAIAAGTAATFADRP